MQQKRFPFFALVATAGIAAFLGLTLWLAAESHIDGDVLHRHPALLMAQLAVTFLMVLVISIGYWRRLDEAAREAHKWSWYWGGTIGLLSLLPIFILCVFQPGFGAQIAADFGATGHELDLGIGMAILFPCIGYVLAWAFWWLKRR